MRQILQNLKTGETQLAEVPCPNTKRGHVLIRTRASLVSAGTERMLVEFGKANLIDKARQQPEKVRMVLDKVRTDGLVATVATVRNKLDQPLPMGYCNVGTVAELGSGVDGLSLGDRVVSNGHHAEMVCVPKNLCARIPDGVSDEEASFAVIGAIGLQGIRLAQPTLGESFVVTGLGLIGLVTVQLLIAHGCRVLGLDYDPDKLALARQFGAETVDLRSGADPVEAAQAFSRGRGVDGVIITASTKSNEPMHQAAQMCRKRGRIILVGVTGLELARSDFYEKELTFQVSCSYGPGRYDPAYEAGGQDYPLGFVRWTEQRNFEAILDMMASGRIDVRPLLSHRFPLERAQEAYALIGGGGPSLGVLLEYPNEDVQPLAELRKTTVSLAQGSQPIAAPNLGFIGAGNYATAVLIPAFKQAGAALKTVSTSGGVSGVHAGKKFGFSEATTDTPALFSDSTLDALVIATRHDTHSRFVLLALEARKHVFVEKPLALNAGEIATIRTAYEELQTKGAAPLVMVGFNRRFAPHVRKMKALLDPLGAPKTMIMTVNAGAIPADHWTQSPEIGGGRIIGEGCHFIDLLRHLAGHPVVSVQATAMATRGERQEDVTSFTLEFADGSIGTVHYLANGNKAFPKERLEVFCAGRILQLDNFRTLRGFGWPGFTKFGGWKQDKGQRDCAAAFVQAIKDGRPSPIPFEELLEVAEVSCRIAGLIRKDA
jgi:predicted dehydrogenase/threonine dehydrogenase-like Zn-dependent dehydrogenase